MAQEKPDTSSAVVDQVATIFSFLYRNNPQGCINAVYNDLHKYDEDITVTTYLKRVIARPLLVILFGIFIIAEAFNTLIVDNGNPLSHPFSSIADAIVPILGLVVLIAGFIYFSTNRQAVEDAIGEDKKLNKALVIFLIILFSTYIIAGIVLFFRCIAHPELFLQKPSFIVEFASVFVAIFYVNYKAHKCVKQRRADLENTYRHEILEIIGSHLIDESEYALVSHNANDDVESLMRAAQSLVSDWYPKRTLEFSDFFKYTMILDEFCIKCTEQLVAIYNVNEYRIHQHEYHKQALAEK